MGASHSGSAAADDSATAEPLDAHLSAARKRHDAAPYLAPGRVALHAFVDKPVYRPGEVVFLAIHVLTAETNVPAASFWKPFLEHIRIGYLNAGVQLSIVDSDDVEVFSDTYVKDITQLESIVTLQWRIPTDQVGGNYKARLKLTEVPNDLVSSAPAERTFNVRAFSTPVLSGNWKLDRTMYGGGEHVAGKLLVRRSTGEAPTDATADLRATVDGDLVFTQSGVKLDENGGLAAEFDLPASIDSGEGLLLAVVRDGGTVQTFSKTLPLVCNKLNVEMSVEGGFAPHLPIRVVVSCRNPLTGDPADFVAHIVAKKAQAGAAPLATVTSVHEGIGLSTEFPAPATLSELELTFASPPGVAPVSLESCIRVNCNASLAPAAPTGVFDAGARPRVRVVRLPEKKENRTVVLQYRAATLQSVALADAHWEPLDGYPSVQSAVIEFDPPSTPGIYSFVLQRDASALAERLVFVRNAEALHVAVAAPTECAPGDSCAATVTVTDANGQPVSGAVVHVRATDKSVLEMVEPRLRHPSWPVAALLEGGVKELFASAALEAALVAGSGKTDDADAALDALLASQHWRIRASGDAFGDLLAGDDGFALQRALAVNVTNKTGADALHNRQHPPPPPPMRFMARNAVFGARPPMFNAPPMMECAMAAAPAGLQMDMDAGAELALGAGAMAMPPSPLPPAPPADAPPADALGDEITPSKPFTGATDLRFDGMRQMATTYSHARRASWVVGDRADFQETVLFSTQLVTDSAGRARVTFDCADSVTTVQLIANAAAAVGSGAAPSGFRPQFGAATGEVQVKAPFYIEARVPLEVSLGDELIVPLALVNGTDNAAEVRVQAARCEGLNIVVPDEPVQLEARGRGRVLARVTLKPEFVGPRGTLSFSARTASGLVDRVTRTFDTRPLGVPCVRAFAGTLEANSKQSFEIVMPETATPGSIQASARFVPTPQSALVDALKDLIREPCGCFEQTSSTCYPLIMALQYFKAHNAPAALVDDALGKLKTGYARLAGYETSDSGFEWFGASPPHEALTAYGIMEFSEMQQVFGGVDAKMMTRTRELLKRIRVGDGTYKRNSKALDSFGAAPDDVTIAYILWAVTVAGQHDVDPEIKWVQRAVSQKDSDPYLAALLSLSLFNVGRMSDSLRVAEALAKLQEKDGSITIPLKCTSITCSSGDSLKSEVAALFVMACLNHRTLVPYANITMAFLMGLRGSWGWGSTQATILALKALLAFEELMSKPRAEGAVRVYLDDNVVAAQGFAETHEGAIEPPEFGGELKLGAKQTLTLEMFCGSSMPFKAEVVYNSTLPPSSEACALDLFVDWPQTRFTEGDVATLKVQVSNKLEEGVGMCLAVIGLPGGLEWRVDKLDELERSGAFAKYSLEGARQVALYWRSFGPHEQRTVPLEAVAAVPGTYTAAASRAFVYYSADAKVWLPGTTVHIVPRA